MVPSGAIVGDHRGPAASTRVQVSPPSTDFHTWISEAGVVGSSRASTCRRRGREGCRRPTGSEAKQRLPSNENLGSFHGWSRSPRRRSWSRSRSRRPCSRSRPPPRSCGPRGSRRSRSRPAGAAGRCRRSSGRSRAPEGPWHRSSPRSSWWSCPSRPPPAPAPVGDPTGVVQDVAHPSGALVLGRARRRGSADAQCGGHQQDEDVDVDPTWAHPGSPRGRGLSDSATDGRCAQCARLRAGSAGAPGPSSTMTVPRR